VIDPPLLEREPALTALRQALEAARAGDGRCVCLVGEAGIGKTRLLDAFVAQAPGAVQWLRAACDPLHTPRPLGPLIDIAPRLPPALGDAVHAARTHNGLFPDLLDWLRRTTPTPVWLLDDLQWADEATLDAVRYLGRRLAGLPTLLVLAWRDDGAGPPEGLRRALAQIDAARCMEIRLAPLSAEAVSTLVAGSGRDPATVLSLSAGNPLFVQQIVATPAGRLPVGVREAVLARLLACDAEARAVAEAISIAPGGLPWSLLTALPVGVHDVHGAVDRLIVQGLVRIQPPDVAFRHDLARQAVHDALPPARRLRLHAAMADALAALPPRPGLLARRVHHAAEGGRPEEVCALASAAAEEAGRVGATAEAVALLERALAQADAAGAGDRERAVWWAALGRLRARRRDHIGAAAAWEASRVHHERLGDAQGQAHALANLALLSSPRPESVDQARRARDLLTGMPPSAVQVVAAYALALALVNRGDAASAQAPAAEAVRLAEVVGDPAALSQALSVRAAARLSLVDDEAAYEQLERSIAIAAGERLVDHAAVASVNLVSLCLTHARYPRLFTALARATAYARAHDQDQALALLQLCEAVADIDTGRWDDARRLIDESLDGPRASPRSRASAGVLRQRLRALRAEADEPAAWPPLVQAIDRGETDFQPTDGLAWAAEAAWLRGDTPAAGAWARRGLGMAAPPWLVGRLRRWARLAGEPLASPGADLPWPFRLEEAGRWQEAHDAWAAIGCPHDAALALLEADVALQQQALASLSAMGAAAAAAILRRRLNQRGVRHGMRGPNRAASRHPLGFTPREQQVAALLGQGLANAEIAARLHRSERTVEHHVSAVLAKLGARSRAQAVAWLAGRGVP
jgi:DNA-binding CsgD family transcriptional regulator